VSTKIRTKRRRKHGKPVELSLEELGLMTHIRAHLVAGKFQHKSAAIGKIFGHDRTYISRLVTRLEEKDQIEVDRKQDARGLWLTTVLTPKQPRAPQHVDGCSCYQGLEPKIGETGESTCTGEHNTVPSIPVVYKTVSIDKNNALYDAPLHLDDLLAAARLRLGQLKSTRSQNFNQKNVKYYATEIRKAQDEVWRLQDLLVEARGAR
jgi:hypothetical protein